MSDQETSTIQDHTDKEFEIRRIYIKDVSFEAPTPPKPYGEEENPEVNLQLANSAVTISENLHEIVLTVTVTVKIGNTTAYLVEVKQAGKFNIKGYTDEEMGIMAGVYCPNLLYPYAREVVSDLVSKGGFPQLILAPVNFEGLYQQHLQQAQQGAETAH